MTDARLSDDGATLTVWIPMAFKTRAGQRISGSLTCVPAHQNSLMNSMPGLDTGAARTGERHSNFGNSKTREPIEISAVGNPVPNRHSQQSRRIWAERERIRAGTRDGRSAVVG